MTAPQGTTGLLEFAAGLEQRAENVRGYFDHRAAAEDLLTCKAIIERLAPLDPDLESTPGEN